MSKRIPFKVNENTYIYAKPAKVTIIVKNDNIEQALMNLKRFVKRTNLLKDYKDKMYYVKPSDKKRYKRSVSKIRSQREII